VTSALVSGAQPRTLGVLPAMVGAEVLKLRKRRGLVAASLALTIGPMVVAYTVLVLMHASNPAAHPSAGGVENFGNTILFLSQLGIVVAFLAGVIAGAADHRAGVFRELVVTGRSRLALFAARVLGGLGFVLPMFIAAFALSAAASIALAGPVEAPGVALLVKSGAWVAIFAAASFGLALGVASLLGSATTSIALLLGLDFAVIPVLRSIDKLGAAREALLPVAIERLRPDGLIGTESSASSLIVAVVAIAGWSLVPLALGAWRTTTRDA
jgi:hypothetical protein